MQPISAKALLAGLWPGAPAGLSITSVVTDNREAAPGCLFVGIKGERADGLDFAPAAFESGAALVLGERPAPGIPKDKMVVVPDVLDAMIAMGANYRAAFSPLVLGITGSVGKTTTKEFCAAVFSAFGETLKTEGNQNNEIGMPKTLFRLTDDVRYAVIEMGMQGPGEIRKLARAAKPSGAIITNIGMAHMQQLGSLENILYAKMEISEGVPMGGTLVLNGDDPLLRGAARPQGLQVALAGIDHPECDVRATEMRREAHGTLFKIDDRQYGWLEAFIPTVGRHNVQDALLAYTAATRLGLNAMQVAAALAAFVPTGMRQRVVEVGGITVIEDFYNAGPDSMKAALTTLAEWETDGSRLAVLGDMLELGLVSEEAHRAVGQQVAAAGVSQLVTVGPLSALAADEAEKKGVLAKRCEDNRQAAETLLADALPGDVVLIKASRGMRFEEIMEAFSEGKADA